MMSCLAFGDNKQWNGADRTLSPAMGKNSSLESPNGYTVWSRWEPRWRLEFRFPTLDRARGSPLRPRRRHSNGVLMEDSYEGRRHQPAPVLCDNRRLCADRQLY